MVLASYDRLDLWPTMSTSTLDSNLSNHLPIPYRSHVSSNSIPKPFRSLNFLWDHPTFIQSKWEYIRSGFTHRDISYKLRRLSMNIWYFHFLNFGEFEDKIKDIESQVITLTSINSNQPLSLSAS